MSRFRARLLLLTLVLMEAAAPASWAQGNAVASPPPQWVVCHGPQMQRRLPGQPAPGASYVSGVSAVPQVSGVDTWTPLVSAYRAFVLEQYGADFEPVCTPYPSEPDAQKWLRSVASGPGASTRLVGTPTVVMTTWTWKPSATDTAKPPPQARKPGTLEH